MQPGDSGPDRVGHDRVGHDRVIYRAILLAAGLLVLGLLFRQLVTLLLAVLLTIVIAIPLAACANRLARYRVPRALGVLVGLLLGLGVIVGAFALVIPPFVEQTREFITNVPAIVSALQADVQQLTGAAPGEVGERVRGFLEGFLNEPERLIGPITSVGLSVAAIAGAIVLVLLTAYYIAVNPQPLVDGALALFPPNRRGHALYVMQSLRTSWIGWMQGVAADMVVSGVLLYVGLLAIGIDFALTFAVFTALLVVVPYFGAIIGLIPPLLFALADSPGKALLVLAVYAAVQQLEGNVIIPLVMSRAVRLHPAVIAVGVVVVGQLFGFVGLVVAVPILSTIVILTRELWVKPQEDADERGRLERELPAGGETA
ncbi:MAG: AI-2E family transporter, partial [Actinomycetota bacterium]|nr:AI-2E family transporter [Actinomycetota bacterium]